MILKIWQIGNYYITTILGFSSAQIIIFLETMKFSCHFYIIKNYFKAKRRRIMETQIFHHAINIIFKTNHPLKETKILQDIIIITLL